VAIRGYRMGSPPAGGRMSGPGHSGRVTEACFAVLAAAMTVAVWLGSYPAGDCDDKAVHYYSAAYVFAPEVAREVVRDALPGWLERLPPEAKKLRLQNRILSAWNYPAADVAIGVARAMAGGGAFTRAVKLGTAALFCAALAWLIVSAGVLDRGRLVVALVLLAGASGAVMAPPLVAMPRINMSPFTSYVPRGSACFLVLAMFMASAARRRWLAGVGALLVALWHTAFALIVLPMAAVGLLFGAAAPAKGGGPAVSGCGPAGVVLPALAVAAGCAATGWGASMVHAGRVPVIMSGAMIASHAWSASLLAAVVAVWLRRRWASPLGEAYDRLMLSALGFLLCIKLFLLTHGVMQVWAGTGDIGGIYLAHQMPMRLGGVDYLHGLLVMALALVMLGARWKSLPAWLAAAALVLAVIARRDMMAELAAGRAPAWNERCAVEAREDLTADELAGLDPADEPAFFRDVGEFLFRSR